jgi:hypothetical protein
MGHGIGAHRLDTIRTAQRRAGAGIAAQNGTDDCGGDETKRPRVYQRRLVLHPESEARPHANLQRVDLLAPNTLEGGLSAWPAR